MPVAEVIESSTRQFTAEVYPDADAPPFGSWVEVRPRGGATLFALVSHVEHSSRDTSRRPRAYGRDEDELRREMPQVHEMLCTTFRAQVLAFRRAEGERVRQTLPPQPARIHDFVRPCEDESVCALGAPYDFLRTLVQSPDPAVPVDDLLVAALQQVHAAHGGARGGQDALVTAGRVLSRLFDDDHERLHSVLRRVS